MGGGFRDGNRGKACAVEEGAQTGAGDVYTDSEQSGAGIDGVKLHLAVISAAEDVVHGGAVVVLDHIGIKRVDLDLLIG